MRPPLVAMLAAIVAAQGCGLVVGFGPDKQLADATTGTGGEASGGQGGLGGQGAEGGSGGQGGEPLPPQFCDPDGDVVWLQTFGDSYVDHIIHLEQAPDGGAYASGYFSGELDLGSGAMVSDGVRDLYVARLDASGQALWSIRYGSVVDEALAPAIAAHPNGVALFGGVSAPMNVGEGNYTPQGPSAAHVTMVSASGRHQWTRWLDGSGQTFGLRVAVDPTTGDVIAFGAFSEQLELGGPPLDLQSNGGNDAMLVRLDGDNGTILDSVSWGGALGDWARGIEVDDSGRIYLAGSTEGQIDFGQGPQPSTGGSDSYAMVFSSDFEIEWARAYDNAGNQHFWDMALAPNGDMIAVGLLTSGSVDLGGPSPVGGSQDAYFVRLSGLDGDIVHGRLIQGIDWPSSLTVDASGDVIFAGEYEDTLVLGTESFQSVAGRGDPVMLKLSSDFSEVKWRDVIVGSAEDEGFADVFVGDDGRVVAGGYFRHDLTVDGCEPRVSAGDADAVLLKRKP